MDKNLAELITELNRAKKTGILALSVKNDSALFKFFFRDGVVYHLTHGTCMDTECLTRLPSCTFDAGMFMPGAQIEAKDKAVPRTEDIIARIKAAGKTVRWDERPSPRADKTTSAPPSPPRPSPDVFTCELLEAELVNIVGPVAGMVLESACNICNIKKGAPISPADLRRLVDTIGQRLPEEQKALFLEKFGG